MQNEYPHYQEQQLEVEYKISLVIIIANRCKYTGGVSRSWLGSYGGEEQSLNMKDQAQFKQPVQTRDDQEKPALSSSITNMKKHKKVPVINCI